MAAEFKSNVEYITSSMLVAYTETPARERFISIFDTQSKQSVNIPFTMTPKLKDFLRQYDDIIKKLTDGTGSGHSLNFPTVSNGLEGSGASGESFEKLCSTKQRAGGDSVKNAHFEPTQSAATNGQNLPLGSR